MLSRLILSAVAAFTAYQLFRVVRVFIRIRNSPWRDLPGPKSSSWIYGNLLDIWDSENEPVQEKWVKEHGPTISYTFMFGMKRLFTTDLRALSYIINNPEDFGKPGQIKYNLSRLLGTGLLIVEGEQHKRQRKIMNPAFGSAQIREFIGIFTEKANQLRDIWLAQTSKEQPTRIDVLSWFSRLTLDVIGLAGFHHEFDNLTPGSKPNELNQAFNVLFRTGDIFSPWPFLHAWFPLLRLIKTERERVTDKARATMNRIGAQLLRESKAAIAGNGNDGTIEKHTLQGRDLLSLLIRANLATDISENQKLSDDEVLARELIDHFLELSWEFKKITTTEVPTFLTAGHETTSSAATWALYALATNLDIQTKLRNELFSLASEAPTMDELNSLQYLDYVVKETLRVYPPVTFTVREATKDCVLLLNTPCVDKKGVVHNGIRMNKGDAIVVPINLINRSKALWGEDAQEFKPERWETPPEATNSIPGIWSNLLTFSGGPRACIGYRFSIMETKVILFSLVRAFRFDLAVPAENIIQKHTFVLKPVVAGETGNQMPLLITPYQFP